MGFRNLKTNDFTKIFQMKNNKILIFKFIP